MKAQLNNIPYQLNDSPNTNNESTQRQFWATNLHVYLIKSKFIVTNYYLNGLTTHNAQAEVQRMNETNKASSQNHVIKFSLISEWVTNARQKKPTSTLTELKEKT